MASRQSGGRGRAMRVATRRLLAPAAGALLAGVLFGLLATLSASPGWSAIAAQERIVFDVTGKDDWGSIFVMRPDGSGLRGFRFDGDHPSLSPDGRDLVFTSVSDGVYVAPLDKPGRRRIAGTEDLYAAAPRWAANGQSIVVDQDSSLTLHSVRASQHGPFREIDTWGEPDDPDWSPDGRRIAYSGGAANGRFAIFAADVRGAAAVQLTRPKANMQDTHPRWSPDGRGLLFTRVTFMAGSSSHSQALYFLLARGGAPQLWIANASSGAWSPDGGRIAYVDRRGHIHVLHLSTRQDRQLNLGPCRNGSFENGYCDNLDWR